MHLSATDFNLYELLKSGKEGNEENNCVQNGVIAPLLGIIGSIQATETLKVLMGIGESLGGRVLLVDALSMEWQSMRLGKDANCPECSSRKAAT